MPIAADDQISPPVANVHLSAGSVVRATPLRPVRDGSCRNIGQCGTSGPIMPVPTSRTSGLGDGAPLGANAPEYTVFGPTCPARPDGAQASPALPTPTH